MTYRFSGKQIILFLIVTLIALGGFLWYKEQTTNKAIPKRANLVLKATGGGLVDAKGKTIPCSK
ncbi:MAG: hypothetical protein WCZ27_07485 [Tissierellaceae bacterium]